MIPSGLIIMWSGAIADIPSGWVLCDGNNGTPDLNYRFVIGAGVWMPVGTRWGSSTHTHAFTSDGHHHTLAEDGDIATGEDYAAASSTDTDSGTTDAGNNLPPFHGLAFIMKT